MVTGNNFYLPFFPFQETIATTIEISKLLSKATWNLECNFHMPIFIARIERGRKTEREGKRDQTKCTTIHTGHTDLSVCVWGCGIHNMIHNIPAVQKICAMQFPKQPHTGKTNTKTKGERGMGSIEMIFHNL